ncbi:MAG TPA: HAMP domain-containing sensor histidine kinase [Nocardioides sp.]|jgi:signal transduction histidine kinase|nr:HAMP domain-containing sensor histidine kinase [Nocardioides sp.]
MADRTASSGWRSGYLVEVCTGLLVLSMIVAMVATPGEETVPYHLLFVWFTLVYGFRIWPVRPTLVVVGAITAVTGIVMYVRVADGTIAGPEITEVLILPLLLLAMVWHAQRRVAAQRQVEAMVEERERRLQREREFLRDTSHAIRTPAAIARGHVELIQAALTDPEAYEDSAVVVRQLDRMCALSARLLALARLDSEAPLALETLELDSFVEQTLTNWKGSVRREWRAHAGAGVVRADREWLELAIDALVENAVHFTGPEDRIELSCRQVDGVGTITVADTGAGIAPEDLPHVFERFWHKRPVDGMPGSGLGLAMAQTAAQAMGGKLDVASDLGIGTRFEMSLPSARSVGRARLPKRSEAFVNGDGNV